MKKYTPVFGPQELFDNAPEHVEVIRFNDYSRDYLWADLNTVKTLTFRDLKAIPIIAMRIIEETPEPKRWTWEDKKAGRLPEVGALIVNVESGDQFSFVGINAGSKRWACMDVQDGFLYFFKPNEMSPIETTTEKAQRLREEWCIKALSSCSILSGMQKYELKRLGGYIEDIYDALLSGKLAAPKGGE